MDMQDKEFDKLFSSKLEGLEIEPSVKVWQNIDAKLKGNKAKKLIAFLSIAASIIVLMAAGVTYFFESDRLVKLPLKNLTINKSTKAIPALTNEHIVVVTKTALLAVSKPVHLHHPVKIYVIAGVQEKGLVANSRAPTANRAPVSAAAAITKTLTKQPVAPDTTKVLTATIAVQQSETSVPVTASLPPVEKATDAVPLKKHKIHGIGDLLNVAIAAVDKRRDKIIEFSDNDGDGTSVSGVNLGIIKVKKEN